MWLVSLGTATGVEEERTDRTAIERISILDRRTFYMEKKIEV
jgi:hypothetical protein